MCLYLDRGVASCTAKNDALKQFFIPVSAYCITEGYYKTQSLSKYLHHRLVFSLDIVFGACFLPCHEKSPLSRTELSRTFICSLWKVMEILKKRTDRSCSKENKRYLLGIAVTVTDHFYKKSKGKLLINMYWNEGTYADICLHYMLAETRENLHMVYYQISSDTFCLFKKHTLSSKYEFSFAWIMYSEMIWCCLSENFLGIISIYLLDFIHSTPRFSAVWHFPEM